MAANTMELEIITPEKVFFEGQAEMIIVTTMDGEEGFMPNHSWTISLLDMGEMWLKEAGSPDFRAAALSGGFIDVKDKIVVYSDYAEWKEEIDVERAERAKAELEAWLSRKAEVGANEEEIARAEIALAREIARIKVSESNFRM